MSAPICIQTFESTTQPLQIESIHADDAYNLHKALKKMCMVVLHRSVSSTNKMMLLSKTLKIV